jgi:hypothetical protein
MSEDYSIARDLEEAEAMADGLADYIRRDALYGNVGGFFSKMPALTVGALLMRLRRLDALRDHMDAGQITRLEKVIQRHQDTAKEWQLHYGQKIEREVKSRLDAMRTFFEECKNDPQLCPRVYKPEANRRTIVQELLYAMEQMNIDRDEELEQKRKTTDNRLRTVVESTDFIWSEILEPVYDRRDYWWLYSYPPAPEQ